MKKLLLPLVAVAALALPASALAWGGGHEHHGAFIGVKDAFSHMGGTKLDGTGTSFGATSASITGSSFSGTLATTWSSASAKTFMNTTLSCAPATASITVGSAAAVSYTGKTCSFARDGTTKYVFYGKADDNGHAFLAEDGTTVKGAVFGPRTGLEMGMLIHANVGMSGHCDNH